MANFATRYTGLCASYEITPLRKVGMPSSGSRCHRYVRLVLSNWPWRVTRFLDRVGQFLRIRSSRLDPDAMRRQIDVHLGSVISRLQRLGDGAGAVAAGHVVDFEGDHRALQWGEGG
jgi:hypothetical protein